MTALGRPGPDGVMPLLEGAEPTPISIQRVFTVRDGDAVVSTHPDLPSALEAAVRLWRAR